MDANTAKRACGTCQAWTLHEFSALLAANGVRQVKGRCLTCKVETAALSYRTLRFMGIDPAAVPVYRRNVGRYGQQPCEVKGCGSEFAEYHHFAPSAVFNGTVMHPGYGIATTESDIWPGAWLCRMHHVDWHRRMSGYQWQQAAA